MPSVLTSMADALVEPRGCALQNWVCIYLLFKFLSIACLASQRDSTRIFGVKPGVAPGIFRRGASSSDEGAKIRFLGYFDCQKSPKKIVFHLPTGELACSDRGAIAP